MKKAIIILSIIVIASLTVSAVSFGITAYTYQERKQLQETINTEIQNEKVYTTQTYNDYQIAVRKANNTINKIFASKNELIAENEQLKNSVDNLKIATIGVYKFSVSYTLLSNNSVGNEWTKYIMYGNTSIQTGSTITKNINEKISLNIKIIEEDKIKDIGTGTVDIILSDGATASTVITVMENAGLYKGNTAKWKVDISVSLIEGK